ncbi:hypothetical protein KP509_26G054900 [Ceratopteris richardii]|nr:hypothetical protein KP509_26G054900 [Ceratopteris richardii]KAH7297127.1 hypothetical protein KP509_26G054900 [Ceratopteris richardii]KAH7297128.1 hypothetical protein KP509_26G054900 [Ceratopteris richardii]KAH7297129.1 hypothetical protein KP509_26G054900 [Ceratopteris richardii]
MAEKPKLLYIIVHDGATSDNYGGKHSHLNSFRYTRPILQSALQLLGCKARHAFKISKRVFEVLREEFSKSLERRGSSSTERFEHDYTRHLSDSELDNTKEYSSEHIKKTAEENEVKFKEIRKKLYNVQLKRSTIVLSREDFMDVVCAAMSEYRYLGPNQRNDFVLASRIREKRSSMTVLLCGTSGCGKSTLSTLLASRLGITTVVSTDSIRHMMRSFVDERQNPLLYASTYSAGEHLDPVAVAEAKAKKRARKVSRRVGNVHSDSLQCQRLSNDRENGSGQRANEPFHCSETDVKGKSQLTNEDYYTQSCMEATVSSKTMAVQGYKAQSEMVIDSLDRLITSWEQKHESVIVEGVHLSLNFVMGLMKKHPSIIPFMIYIANEEKHLERFAVRAKYMTLDPAKNKYAKYIRNIRAIQDYLCKRADKYLIPKVNNTNMDQSVASIHATIFASLRRREGGEPFYDELTNTVKLVNDEFKNQCAANSLGSKGMLQLIRRRGSSRQLMALMNDDGSVAKTWPFESSIDTSRRLIIPKYNDEEDPNPLYSGEALEVSPVNLQFGNFGLSAWQNDMCGTSYSASMDGLSSRGDGVEYLSSHQSSRYGSSCSSSPRFMEGAEKELSNENRASASDDEHDDDDEPDDDAIDLDSEEELNGRREQQIEAELEGSVGDRSCASDEDDEYEAASDRDDSGEDEKKQKLTFRCMDRTILKVSSDVGCKSNSLLHQDPYYLDKVSSCGMMDKSHRYSNSKNSSTDVVARMNGQHPHCRSKSLPPLPTIYNLLWDASLSVGSVKRM